MYRYYLITFVDGYKKEKAFIYVATYSIAEAEKIALEFYENNLTRKFGELGYMIETISSDTYFSHKVIHDRNPELYEDEHFLEV